LTQPVPSVPGNDTKVCPFCAETLKVAAIKCKFCKSKLVDAAVDVDQVEEDMVQLAPPDSGMIARWESFSSNKKLFIQLAFLGIIFLIFICWKLLTIYFEVKHPIRPPALSSATTKSTPPIDIDELTPLQARAYKEGWGLGEVTKDMDTMHKMYLLSEAFGQLYFSAYDTQAESLMEYFIRGCEDGEEQAK
jgi:hypothetical protein